MVVARRVRSRRAAGSSARVGAPLERRAARPARSPRRPTRICAACSGVRADSRPRCSTSCSGGPWPRDRHGGPRIFSARGDAEPHDRQGDDEDRAVERVVRRSAGCGGPTSTPTSTTSPSLTWSVEELPAPKWLAIAAPVTHEHRGSRRASPGRSAARWRAAARGRALEHAERRHDRRGEHELARRRRTPSRAGAASGPPPTAPLIIVQRHVRGDRPTPTRPTSRRRSARWSASSRTSRSSRTRSTTTRPTSSPSRSSSRCASSACSASRSPRSTGGWGST